MSPVREPPNLTRLPAPGVFGVGMLMFGCGGPSALLHPAHPLAESEVSVGAGIASNISFASARRAIVQGKAAAADAQVLEGEEEQAFVEGALTSSTVDPGISPWVSGRVGLGHAYEAGLTYAGHSLRADARKVLETPNLALSFGVGVSALAVQLEEGTRDDGTSRVSAASFDFGRAGWGVDLPLLFGVRVPGSRFEVWTGLRFGVQRVFGKLDSVTGTAARPSDVEGAETDETEKRPRSSAAAQRLGGQAIVGLSAGIGPLSLRLEASAGLDQVWGNVDFPDDLGAPKRRDFSLMAVTLTPAAALATTF